MCQQALLVVSITAVPRSPLCRQMLNRVRECQSAMSLMCFEVLKHAFVRLCECVQLDLCLLGHAQCACLNE